MSGGPNPDQQLLIVEQTVKEKLRRYFTRNYGGFQGISRRTPPDTIRYYCVFRTPDFVAAASRKDVTASKAHRMLTNLVEQGRMDDTFAGWVPHEDACCMWAQEVIDSLHRCGLPFNDDPDAMEHARLKANEDRARRRKLMRERPRT